MFDLLKEKIAAFANRIGKKAGEKPQEPREKTFAGERTGLEPPKKEITDYHEKPPAAQVEEIVLPEIAKKPVEQEKVLPSAAKPSKEKPEKIGALAESISKVKEKLEKAKAEEKPSAEKSVEKKYPEAKEEKPAETEQGAALREKPVLEKQPEAFKEEPSVTELQPEDEFRLSKISDLWDKVLRPAPQTALPDEKTVIPKGEMPPQGKLPETPETRVVAGKPGTEEKKAVIPEKKAEQRQPAMESKKARLPPKLLESEKRELKAKVGAIKTLKGVLQGYVQLGEKEINSMLFELELSLLEADVNQQTATALVQKIKELLVSERIPRGNEVSTFLKEKIREALAELTATEKVNLFELIERSGKPFKLLFLGPNGAGKTTTIAKLSFAFQLTGKSVIWAAADTFRAASIEQLEEHAKRLKIRVVKHKYGADPAAVAFDAVKAAEANHIDVVMVDSAGRQETNKNLIEELKKIERVLKPDFKIFIGEAFAGKGLLEQAKAFDEALGIDGFILTKIDTDAKGGTVLSLLCELKKPVLFIGTGQTYEDLVPFTPQYIIDRIV